MQQLQNLSTQIYQSIGKYSFTARINSGAIQGAVSHKTNKKRLFELYELIKAMLKILDYKLNFLLDTTKLSGRNAYNPEVKMSSCS